MTAEELRAIALSLKASTEDIKWGDHLCFSVGAKMYCILGTTEVPVTASFKAADEEFEELSERKGCKPAPYMARHKWIKTGDISNFSKEEWQYYLEQAHKTISGKLPKKLQKELGLS